MVLGCYSAQGAGPLVRVKCFMDKNVPKKIHIRNAKHSLSQQNLSVFQRDNDPKHTAKTLKQYIQGKDGLLLY